jgi:hypothetical protein
MYHVIEFAADVQVDLQTSPRDRLERVLIRRGDRLWAQLRPHVEASATGPVEMADLFFEDGSAVRGVRYAFFRFVE